MVVKNPWDQYALVQQLLANLIPGERTGFSVIDMLISPRQEAMLREMMNIFAALEAGETLHREMLHEKGD
jgi:hypothetical protein